MNANSSLRFIAPCILLAVCLQTRAAGPPDTPEFEQGIHGRAVKMAGDFTMDPPTGSTTPLRAPIHVFRGVIMPFEKPEPKHPSLVAVLQPDKDGRFDIALPPGEYTVVAEIDGNLYLNNWMDDGSWARVTVREGKWTDFTLEDVLEATF